MPTICRRFLLAVSIVVAAMACAKQDPPAGTDPKTPAKPSAMPASTQWACTTDVDCSLSCAKGAVSKKWYDAWDKSGECKDGCAEDRKARCVDGACAAFWSSGKADPECTRK